MNEEQERAVFARVFRPGQIAPGGLEERARELGRRMAALSRRFSGQDRRALMACARRMEEVSRRLRVQVYLDSGRRPAPPPRPRPSGPLERDRMAALREIYRQTEDLQRIFRAGGDEELSRAAGQILRMLRGLFRGRI